MRPFGYVSSFLQPEHFCEPLHAKLFEIIADLITASKIANPITLKAYLPPDIKKLKIGGLTIYQYLARLSAEATTVINAANYARGIIDLARRRRIIEIADGLKDAALADDDPELPAKARDAFADIAKTAIGASQRLRLTPFRDILLSTAPAQVVCGIIPRAGLVIVWGPPKMRQELLGV
jgi:replicative DNA helicase